MDSIDHPARTPVATETRLSGVGAGALLVGAIVWTLLEWALYGASGVLGLARDVLVPLLLVSSLGKLTGVVFGMTRLAKDPGVAMKTALAALVSLGGLALVFVELLR